jgi:hypothetical protein
MVTNKTSLTRHTLSLVYVPGHFADHYVQAVYVKYKINITTFFLYRLCNCPFDLHAVVIFIAFIFYIKKLIFNFTTWTETSSCFTG